MKNEVKDEGQFQGHYIDSEGWESWCDGGEDPADIKPETLHGNGSEQPEGSGKATVTISGKSFEVDNDFAQEYTKMTQGIDRRFDERSQELGALRQYKSAKEQEEQQLIEDANKQHTPVDYSTLMYEDPNGFVSEFDKKIAASEQRMTESYQKAENNKKQEEQFWDNIWSENKDLALIKDRAADVVSMVGRKYENLNLQNTKETRDFLAKETRAWFKGVGGSNTTNSSDGFVEGSTSQPTGTVVKKEERPRLSTKQIMDARREKKNNAMVERK